MRQVTCYSGVAPLEYTMENILHCGSKASPPANEKVKTLHYPGAPDAFCGAAELHVFQQ
jgi:hypothetical protein